MNVSVDELLKERKHDSRKRTHNHRQFDPHSILITNLHWNVSKADLEEMFSLDNQLISVKVKYDNSGRSEGEARVAFKSHKACLQAKEQYQGQELDGMTMSIKIIEITLDRRLGKATGAAGIESRLGGRSGKIESRLGSKIGDIANRLGQKEHTVAKKQAKKQQRRHTNKPKTATDLDVEMDSYMNQDEPAEKVIVVVDDYSKRQVQSYPEIAELDGSML